MNDVLRNVSPPEKNGAPFGRSVVIPGAKAFHDKRHVQSGASVVRVRLRMSDCIVFSTIGTHSVG
jgi:hypothetical protein